MSHDFSARYSPPGVGHATEANDLPHPGFRPVEGDPDCDRCVALERIARRNGSALTFVRETSDLFPIGVRVYVHPMHLDIARVRARDRDAYRGPWFAGCPNQCEVSTPLMQASDSAPLTAAA
jgi:hypothetical protein